MEDPLFKEGVKACRDEFKAYLTYSLIARLPFIDRRLRDILVRASKDELRHYKFWKSITGECSERVSLLTALLLVMAFILFGATFISKLLESMESSAVNTYEALAKMKPELSFRIKSLEDDEKIHELEMMKNIDEERVKYLGSIALGISDALIELTGIYAGSLGAFASGISAGLTGLLAGIAASASMGIAAYMQARHESGRNPIKSATYTALAYITVSILLALPYFTIGTSILAFITMIVVALLISAYMALYTSVLHNKRFTREFIETALPLFGIALLLLVIGIKLRELLNIEI